jgi:hypothetical protein
MAFAISRFFNALGNLCKLEKGDELELKKRKCDPNLILRQTIFAEEP